MPSDGALRLTRILHPCVLVEGGAPGRVLFDPCFGAFARRWTAPVAGVRLPPPGVDPGSLGPLGLIALTHGHEDHAETAPLLKAGLEEARCVVGEAALARRLRREGFRRVDVLPTWETMRGDGWSITSLPARAPNARVEVSYLLETAGRRILHAGDTAWHDRFPEIRERCAPEIGCLPVNGVSFLGWRLTMDAEEAARAASALGLGVAIPIHADMSYRRATGLAYRTPGTEAAFAAAASRLAPGVRVLAPPRGTPAVLP